MRDQINRFKEYAILFGDMATGIEQLTDEREATVAVLRELCHALGDNDWPDSLPLPEVIQQHLAAHILDDK